MLGDKRNDSSSYFTAPLLVVSSTNLPIPRGAKRMFVFPVAAGGSGGVDSTTNPYACGGSQGAFGAIAFDMIMVRRVVGAIINTVGIAIGAAAPGASCASGSYSLGSKGGNTVVSIGNISLVADGGKGGLVNQQNNVLSGGSLYFNHKDGSPSSGILIDSGGRFFLGEAIPLVGSTAGAYGAGSTQNPQVVAGAGSSGYSSSACYHAAASGLTSGYTAVSTNNNKVILPQWVSDAGLALGTGGAPYGSNAGGAPSFNGVGGDTLNSTSAGSAATGYGGGSGGRYNNGGALSTGSSAPGCCVVMWEIER